MPKQKPDILIIEEHPRVQRKVEEIEGHSSAAKRLAKLINKPERAIGKTIKVANSQWTIVRILDHRPQGWQMIWVIVEPRQSALANAAK